jgi:hypothetical protein
MIDNVPDFVIIFALNCNSVNTVVYEYIFPYFILLIKF